jgi:hypothetical protein
MLEYNNKSASLQGLPNKKGNSRPYIAFSDRSRYRILVNRINVNALNQQRRITNPYTMKTSPLHQLL